jgi:hypothetical protein
LTTDERLGDLHCITVEKDHWGDEECDGCGDGVPIFTLDSADAFIILCRGCAETLHAKLGEMLKEK